MEKKLEEKIYITSRICGDRTEYVLKDVFVEKVVNYLNSKLYDWVRVEHPNPSISPDTIVKQDFIEDFKKYMEEE